METFGKLKAIVTQVALKSQNHYQAWTKMFENLNIFNAWKIFLNKLKKNIDNSPSS
jgi:hypothetical protein